jgi:hypothetical protein
MCRGLSLEPVRQLTRKSHLPGLGLLLISGGYAEPRPQAYGMLTVNNCH